MSRQRIRLRMPWYYILGIPIAGLAITIVVSQSNFASDRSRDDALNSAVAASVGIELGTKISEFYAPTVAGEGFVAAAIEESRELGVPESEVMKTSFPFFAAPIVKDLGPALLDYQLAPAGIVVYSADPERNAAALGHNLFIDDARRDDILRTVQARQPIVTGPVELKQGGQGVIIRNAVFLPGLRPFRDRFAEVSGSATQYEWMDEVPDDFWGFVTTVVNFTVLSEGIELQGLSEDEFAVRIVERTGELSESILGTLSADSAHIVQQFVTLPDGGTWVVQVGVVRTPLWHVWPILLIGVLVTAALTLISMRTYQLRQADRLSVRFSRATAHANEGKDVLIEAGRLLEFAVPGVKGRIRVPRSNFSVPIPPSVNVTSEESTPQPESQEAWPITFRDEVEAIIEIEDPTQTQRRDVGQVVGVIGLLLGATLAGLAQRDRLEELSSTDHLTEVLNRRLLQPRFDELARIAAQRSMSLGIAVVDVDEFKSVNDIHGHLFGDEVLRTLGEVLRQEVRETDSVFRFGGDEFVVLCLLPGEAEGLTLFRRVRQEATRRLGEILTSDGSITVSLGCAIASGAGAEEMNEILAKADQALYRAKELGGNRFEEWKIAEVGRAQIT